MSWIITYTGKKFDFLNPTADMVCIEDIAHALSQLCRWTGHTAVPWTVAQHSLMVSYDVCKYDVSLALEGLLHDAPEAYCQDLSAPLKGLLPSYSDVEGRVGSAIARRFGLHVCDMSDDYRRIHAAVKTSDYRLLATEFRDLFDHGSRQDIFDDWGWRPPEPLKLPLMPMTSKEAEAAFLKRFHELHTGN